MRIYPHRSCVEMNTEKMSLEHKTSSRYFRSQKEFLRNPPTFDELTEEKYQKIVYALSLFFPKAKEREKKSGDTKVITFIKCIKKNGNDVSYMKLFGDLGSIHGSREFDKWIKRAKEWGIVIEVTSNGQVKDRRYKIVEGYDIPLVHRPTVKNGGNHAPKGTFRKYMDKEID